MKNDEWFRIQAKALYHEDGEIEVDSDARVSIGDDAGAYVEAWVWVPLKEEQSGSEVRDHSPTKRSIPRQTPKQRTGPAS